MKQEAQQYHEDLASENRRAYEVATRLDARNPELPGAFTGTPMDRIERQLPALLAAAERALVLEEAIRKCLREHDERGYQPDHMQALRATIDRVEGL